jgi:hypothetical protein
MLTLNSAAAARTGTFQNPFRQFGSRPWQQSGIS